MYHHLQRNPGVLLYHISFGVWEKRNFSMRSCKSMFFIWEQLCSFLFMPLKFCWLIFQLICLCLAFFKPNLSYFLVIFSFSYLFFLKHGRFVLYYLWLVVDCFWLFLCSCQHFLLPKVYSTYVW